MTLWLETVNHQLKIEECFSMIAQNVDSETFFNLHSDAAYFHHKKQIRWYNLLSDAIEDV